MKKLEIYTLDRVATTEQPYFFGEAKNTQRFDKNRYEWLSKQALEFQRLFWVPEEIKLNKDKMDFNTATKAELWILTKQLSKLEFLDSYQGRNPLLTFGQLTTSPELEGILLEQTYFESRLHARSYSYMIENIYPNPDEVFEDIWSNEVLLKHAKTVVKEGNNLYELVIEHIYKTQKSIEITEDEIYNLKKSILLAFVSMNILEGIRFYLGFASVWALTEFSNKFPGSSKILQFIQRDERKHLGFTQYMINQLKKLDGWKSIWEEIQPTVYEMYFTASEEEFEWADYLYSNGSILGMNGEVGKQYVKYITNQRTKAIGIKKLYPEIKENPISWLKKYINLSTSETALQESEAVDYISDPINDNGDFKKSFNEALKFIENLLK